MSTFIPTKKRIKSDILKTQKNILISYTGFSKYLKAQASYTHQVLIASEPIINKNKKFIDLFVKHLLPLPNKLFQTQTGEPKPRGQLCKKPCSEKITIKENVGRDKLVQIIVQIQWIKIHLVHNPKPRKDPDGTTSKKLVDRLKRPTQEFAKSVTETKSKVQEPKTYNEGIINPVYGNRWQQTIDKELQNLDLCFFI